MAMHRAGKTETMERTPLLSSPSSSAAASLDEESREAVRRASKSTDVEDGEKLSTVRGSLICISIWVLIFILTSNVSVLTTIQSPIAIDLDASTEVTWFTSIYLIAVTSITPIAGRIMAIFTPRVYLLASIVVQALGLLITSQAQSLGAFLAGRAVTGVGSASITPVAFILVTELTSVQRRGLFFGCINTGYTAGVACGAIIAGALEPLVGWRAVFWLQIPFSLSVAILAFFAIPPPRDDDSERLEPATTDTAEQQASLGQKLSQIDYFGIITLIGAVVLLLYSLSSPEIKVTPIILAFMSLNLFVLVEAKWAQEPIVPTTVLRSRGNILTGIATVGVMMARWGVLFYTPNYVLTLRGWSQASAGLTLIPTNLGFGCGGLLAGGLHIRRSMSFYFSCLVAYGLFSLSMFSVSWISTPDSNIYLDLVVLFINGLIAGALLNYSLAHVLHLTHPATHIIVIPLNAMFRSLSGSFGSSISGGLFLRTLQQTLQKEFAARGITGKSRLIRQLLGTPILVQRLHGVDREVALRGYEAAFKTMYLAGGVLTIAVLLVQAGTGWTAPDLLTESDDPATAVAGVGDDSASSSASSSASASTEHVASRVLSRETEAR